MARGTHSKLVIISDSWFVRIKGKRIKYVMAQCDCGSPPKQHRYWDITNKCVRSCGCLQAKGMAHWAKHRLIEHPLYQRWSGIKARCHNTKSPSYKNYGARGITVCDEWKNNFQTFYDWAIRSGWNESLLIDRIDNSKGYCPENCRFTTYAINNQNRRSTKLNRQKAEEIRNKFATKKYNHVQLSKLFNISRASVSLIVNNKTWI